MSERLLRREEDRGAVWRADLITFPRVGRFLLRLGSLTALPIAPAALFGCAPAKPPVVLERQAVVMEPAGSAYGTVAAVRPIGVAATGGGAGSGSGPRADILAALGGSRAVAAGGAGTSEFVVQTDNGQTLSVVQADSAGLTPGARVMVLPAAGGRRLVPVPPAS